MKGVNIDRILSVVVIALLAILILQRCNKTTTVEPDSTQEILAKLQSSFDSLETETLSTIVADISILDEIVRDNLSDLTEAQKELIKRVQDTEHQLRRENKELKQFIAISTETRDTIHERMIIYDSTGVKVDVPQWFKELPWQIRAKHHDQDDYVNIFYDLLSDSVMAEINIRNQFEVKQFTDEKGDHFVEVNNLNPKTYTLPGSGAFLLDLPKVEEQKQITTGIQLGIGVDQTGTFHPYLGVGVQYSPQLRIRNIFRRK